MCCATFRFWADSDIPDSARRRNLCSPSHERSILLMENQYIRIPVRTVTELHAEAFDDIAECAAVRANAPLTEGRIHAPAARNKDVRGLRQVWPLLLPGRRREPWHRTVHLLRRPQSGSGSRRGGSVHLKKRVGVDEELLAVIGSMNDTLSDMEATRNAKRIRWRKCARGRAPLCCAHTRCTPT
jgi:hypothetical protein